MKTTVSLPREIDVKYVCISVAVRYGEEDIPNDFPLRQGDTWTGKIDIDNGSIVDWPKGKEGVLSMKVCDEGTYELFDVDMESISRLENDYVPNNLLPGEYGDYIDLKIDSNGTIYNWYSSPSLIDFFPEP